MIRMSDCMRSYAQAREVALPMTMHDRLPDERTRKNARLCSIALALGKPETAFTDEPKALADLDETVELLRIWSSLQQAVSRRKVLAVARALAAQQ